MWINEEIFEKVSDITKTAYDFHFNSGVEKEKVMVDSYTLYSMVEGLLDEIEELNLEIKDLKNHDKDDEEWDYREPFWEDHKLGII